MDALDRPAAIGGRNAFDFSGADQRISSFFNATPGRGMTRCPRTLGWMSESVLILASSGSALKSSRPRTVGFGHGTLVGRTASYPLQKFSRIV